MTDDQTVSMFDQRRMPFTTAMFDKDGTVFDQAIAAAPLCCPSRAGFLTGRYSQNTGVIENTIGYRSLKGKEATVAVALQEGGYRTGMIGKFLNGYEPYAAGDPAPGFDKWFTIYGYAGYTDYQVSDQGEIREEPGYATEVLTDEAIEFAEESISDDAPFFVWLAYNAPHTVAPGSEPPCDQDEAQPPSPEAYEKFADDQLPRPKTFNERDISDKVSLEDGPDRLDAKDIRETTKRWRCASAATAAVDSELERLVESLRADGELEETVFVFLSDNGLFNGEYRLTDDKRLPLEPSLRIPMAIRVGSKVKGAERAPDRVPELVSQVDLAPTLLDYAGAENCDGCRPMDGLSLRPLLEDRKRWPRDRAIPFSLGEGWFYDAYRSPTELYMELSATRYGTFDEPRPELYDLRADPDELDAITDPRDPRVTAASKRLDKLTR